MLVTKTADLVNSSAKICEQRSWSIATKRHCCYTSSVNSQQGVECWPNDSTLPKIIHSCGDISRGSAAIGVER
jgi:hypothetical protein